MFDKMAQQLDLQTLGKGKKDFKISKQEFESFCKGFLFEEIKGNTNLGEVFLEKYEQSDCLLSILGNKSAREHIKTFYIK